MTSEHLPVRFRIAVGPTVKRGAASMSRVIEDKAREQLNRVQFFTLRGIISQSGRHLAPGETVEMVGGGTIGLMSTKVLLLVTDRRVLVIDSHGGVRDVPRDGITQIEASSGKLKLRGAGVDLKIGTNAALDVRAHLQRAGI
ncbi:hypothetical protein FSW04_09885 [Baekduia soli]|uniref:Uncharacterized protein n=1 Tax=Baekduia soli TaxID=496014 RepID=A0A5B8U440_9ACTN|nr:hypothetical protein [Baekduia soli]QEC47849.1 hypothetical protein FSW04_09885 [Baekduia soli]